MFPSFKRIPTRPPGELVENPDYPVLNKDGALIGTPERQKKEQQDNQKLLQSADRGLELGNAGLNLHRPYRQPSPDPYQDAKYPQSLRAMSRSQLSIGHERSNSEYGSDTELESQLQERYSSRATVRPVEAPEPDDSYPMRHGWDAQYRAEQLAQLATSFYLYYNDKRHERPRDAKLLPPENLSTDWRMRDRLKTVQALIVLCLNIGIDPPDVLKIAQPARIECWIDPMTCTSPSGGNIAVSQISKAIERQYLQLSIRTKYRVLPDPGMEDIKKAALHARRQAKDERILFHYNGHGVPKPTSSGEIWVFNRDFTQYIPVPLYELQNWIASPSLFLWEINSAALVVQNFNEMVRRHEAENEQIRRRDPDALLRNFSDCIHLMACRADESLPQTPLAPADLFTSCLTSPIEMAVRFFVWRQPLCRLKPDEAVKIPGKAQERRTPMGELNWIFTAITDTIAWNILPRPLFKKLFRQDLMVAALFRNFLLAQRVMQKFGIHPQSQPAIPDTAGHHLWASWDFAVELVLQQLPNLKLAEEGKILYEYQNSEFFYQQLTAFELYLEDGANEQEEPEQLPIVLQVLLSQVHRLRALILLSRFLDNGPWAVELALSIGIFPYVLKLLQSQAVELKPPLVFIWTRIMAVDQACQTDLVKDNGYTYFISILQPNTGLPVRDVNEHRAMCAFILATFVRRCRQTQDVALNSELMSLCLEHLSIQNTEHPLLRQWSCLCLGNLWENFPEAKWIAIKHDAHLRVCELALDPVPEVRASMLHAMSTFMDVPFVTGDVVELESYIMLKLLPMVDDGSNLVRKELVVFLAVFVARHVERFVAAATELIKSEAVSQLRNLNEQNSKDSTSSIRRRASTSTNGSKMKGENQRPKSQRGSPKQLSSSLSSTATVREHFSNTSLESGATNTTASAFNLDKIFLTTWKHLLYLALDPDTDVAKNADYVVAFVEKKISASEHIRLMRDLVGGVVKRTSPKRRPLAHAVSAPLLALRRSPLPTPTGSSPAGHYFSPKQLNGALGAAVTPSRPAAPLRAYTSERPTMIDSRKSRNLPTSPPEQGRWPSDRVPGVESFLYDDQRVYFTEPQMRPPEADLHGSPAFNERLMQQVMVEATLSRTQAMKEEAGSSRWDRPYGHMDNKGQPYMMTAHQFQNHLAVAERSGTIRIFDYEQHKLLSTFHNGNLPGSQITGVKFINEDFITPNLIVGSDDGVITIHSGYEDSHFHRIAANFRASTDSIPTGHYKYSDPFAFGPKSAGTFEFDFVQATGKLFAVGNSREIQMWDTGREMTSNDLPLGTTARAKSITTDQVTGQTVAVGFWDGSIRIYDQRVGVAIKRFSEHDSVITNIHFQRGGQRELASGARDGIVKTWDIRMDRSLLTVEVTPKGEHMDQFIVHEHDPVFAVGTQTGLVKVYNVTTGSFLSSFSPVAPVTRRGRPPVRALAFHPHKTILYCGQQFSNIVSMFTCNEDKYRQRIYADSFGWPRRPNVEN